MSSTTTMSPPYQITESSGPLFPKTREKQTQKESIGDLEAFVDATATTRVVFPSFVGKNVSISFPFIYLLYFLAFLSGKKGISGTWKKWRELKKLQWCESRRYPNSPFIYGGVFFAFCPCSQELWRSRSTETFLLELLLFFPLSDAELSHFC